MRQVRVNSTGKWYGEILRGYIYGKAEATSGQGEEMKHYVLGTAKEWFNYKLSTEHQAIIDQCISTIELQDLRQ